MVSKSILSQYRCMCEELAEIKTRVEKTRTELNKIVEDGTVKDSVKGGVGGIQTFRIEGFPTSEYQKKKALLNSRLESQMRLEKRVEETITQVNEFIESVSDSFVRRIMVMKYVDGMSFDEIGAKLGYDRSSIHKRLYSYLSDKKSL